MGCSRLQRQTVLCFVETGRHCLPISSQDSVGQEVPSMDFGNKCTVLLLRVLSLSCGMCARSCKELRLDASDCCVTPSHCFVFHAHCGKKSCGPVQARQESVSSDNDYSEEQYQLEKQRAAPRGSGAAAESEEEKKEKRCASSAAIAPHIGGTCVRSSHKNPCLCGFGPLVAVSLPPQCMNHFLSPCRHMHEVLQTRAPSMHDALHASLYQCMTPHGLI